jgi:uncharacterized membrane protein
MESRAKLLGHPVHPMLVVFPLGLLIASVVFDVLFMATGYPVFAEVAFWNIAGGIVGGLAAAVFGLIDYYAIPHGTRARRIGLLHGLGNVTVVALFALSLWIRWTSGEIAPPLVALALSFMAVGLGAVAGWLGGELVDRLGVGVDEGAHLDAPSSLRHERVPVTNRPM